MKVLAAIVVALATSQVAHAQTTAAKPADLFFDPVLNQLGVYLTAPVADGYRRAVAAKFLEGATQAGFNSLEAKSFTDGMLSGNIRFESDGNRIVSNDASVRFGVDRPKVDYLLSFRSVQSAATILARFSTIKLIVNPAPPRDYKVVINGQECPATEAGIYKVMPGESVVNATRLSRAQCEWHGPIAPGAVQEVNCPL